MLTDGWLFSAPSYWTEGRGFTFHFDPFPQTFVERSGGSVCIKVYNYINSTFIHTDTPVLYYHSLEDTIDSV